MTSRLLSYGEVTWSRPAWQDNDSRMQREAKESLERMSRDTLVARTLKLLSKEERLVLRTVFEMDSPVRRAVDLLIESRSFSVFGHHLSEQVLRLVCRIVEEEDDLDAVRILRWLAHVVDSRAFLTLTKPTKSSALSLFERSPFSLREALSTLFRGADSTSGFLLNPCRFGEESFFEALLASLEHAESEETLGTWVHETLDLLQTLKRTLSARSLSDVRKRSSVRSLTLQCQRGAAR